MIFAKFDWKWPSGSGEDDFLKSSMFIHYFVIISPWKKGGVLYLKKIEFPSLKDDLC